MPHSSIQRGLDVHKGSITLAVLQADAPAPTRVDRLPHDPPRLVRYLARLARDAGIELVGVPVIIRYPGPRQSTIQFLDGSPATLDLGRELSGVADLIGALNRHQHRNDSAALEAWRFARATHQRKGKPIVSPGTDGSGTPM